MTSRADEQPSAEAAFREGLRRGEDPVNITVASGPAITTRYSTWCGKYCRRCYHNFRPDDPVEIAVGPDGKIAHVHHDDRLVPWCGRDLDVEQGESAVGRQFFEAIDAENPPLTKHTRRLHPGDPLLQIRDTVRDRDRRARCFACVDSFRPYEFVLTCVCHPDDPQGCTLTIHQDPAHAKPCFENWRLSSKILKCPMDMRIPGDRG